MVGPASRCPSCGRGLRWFENVPVVSWILLGGRCRTCRNAISMMYPTVEAVTAFVFALQCSQVGWQPLLGVRLVFVAVMIVLCVIDLQTKILPDVITVPGVAVGLVSSCFLEPGWTSSLVGMVAGGVILWATGRVYFLIRGQYGMGMGDVKMIAMIGFWMGLPTTIIIIILSSLLGSLVGIGLILFRKMDRNQLIPYGSFLSLTAIILWIYNIISYFYEFEKNIFNF